MTFTQPLIPLKNFSTQDRWIGLCLVGGYTLLMLFLQPQITVNDGQGWDGYYYYRMAINADTSGIYFPLWLRYGLPWLMGTLPGGDVFLNFKVFNFTCAVLHAAACYYILVKCSKDMHPVVPVIGWFLICASNLAPIPSVLWYPVQTDAACNLLALVFLIMVITGRAHFLPVALLFFVGTAIRENFPEFLLYGLLGLRFPLDRQKLLMLTSGFIASLLGLLSIYLYTEASPLQDKLSFALQVIRDYMGSPLNFATTLINSVGAVFFIILASCCAKTPARHGEHLFGIPFAKLIITLTLVIGLVGGTNPERYIYWSLPFYVLCLLPALHNLLVHRYYLLLATCVAWALFIQRALVPIDLMGVKKDCGITAILTGHSNWIGHWSDQCSPEEKIPLVTLAVAVMTVIVLLALFTRRAKN